MLSNIRYFPRVFQPHLNDVTIAGCCKLNQVSSAVLCYALHDFPQGMDWLLVCAHLAVQPDRDSTRSGFPVVSIALEQRAWVTAMLAGGWRRRAFSGRKQPRALGLTLDSRSIVTASHRVPQLVKDASLAPMALEFSFSLNSYAVR